MITFLVVFFICLLFYILGYAIYNIGYDVGKIDGEMKIIKEKIKITEEYEKNLKKCSQSFSELAEQADKHKLILNNEILRIKNIILEKYGVKL